MQLTRKSGREVAQVARELVISDHVLYHWMNEQRHVEPQGSTRRAVRAEQEERTRLKREHETLRKERDCLRRAAAFFARRRVDWPSTAQWALQLGLPSPSSWSALEPCRRGSPHFKGSRIRSRIIVRLTNNWARRFTRGLCLYGHNPFFIVEPQLPGMMTRD